MRSGKERVKKRGRKIEDLKGENKEESEKGWGKRGGKKWREDFGCIGEILARKPNGLHKSCA